MTEPAPNPEGPPRGRGGPSHRGGAGAARARRRGAPRRRRQLPPAAAGHLGRRPPGRRPRAGRAVPPVRLGLSAPSAGPARDARDLRRALHRRDGRRRSGLLHPGERPVRRRLHRAPGDSGRLPPHRHRARDALEVEEGRQRAPPVPAAGPPCDRLPARRVHDRLPGLGGVRRDPRGPRVRADPGARHPVRGRLLHDERRAPARGLVRAHEERRDGDRHPRPQGPAEARQAARRARLRRPALRPARGGRERGRSERVRLGRDARRGGRDCVPAQPAGSGRGPDRRARPLGRRRGPAPGSRRARTGSRRSSPRARGSGPCARR